MLRGFREFISRGNVVDLAVAVIIGAAFGSVVDSLVKDIVTPIIGAMGGQPDFSAIRLGPLGLGSFVNALIAFLMKAAGLYFLIVVPFNHFAAKQAAAPAEPATPAWLPLLTAQEALLREIRDLLRQRTTSP